MADRERHILSAHDCWTIWGGHDHRSGWAIINGWSAECEVDERGNFVIVREFDPDKEPQARLESIRTAIRAESISYGEIAELQGLVEHIDPFDNELLEWAGVPEEEAMARQAAIQQRD